MFSKKSKTYHSEEERIAEAKFIEKRALLLSKIHDLENTSASSSDVQDQILHLKAQNNRILEEHPVTMARIRHGQPVDPCRRLPVEVFTAIIDWTRGPLDSYRWSIDQILSLTLVSISWRNAILATPSLWNEILVAPRTDHLDMKLSTALYLSGNSPIQLQIQYSSSLWERVKPLLLPHKNRISDLALSLDYMADRSRESIQVVLQQLGRLPHMNSFQCDRFWYSEEAVIASMGSFLNENQHVQRVSGVLVTRDILSSPVCKRLKSCQTMMDPQAILSELEAIPSLEEVTFMRNYFLVTQADPYHDEREVTYLPKAPLKWKSYSQYGKLYLEILHSISTTVTSLSLHICACDLWSLCSVLCNFTTLKNLVLFLAIGDDHPFTPPLALLPLPCQTLRSFNLYFELGHNIQGAGPRYTQDWHFPFQEILHHTCGSTESLNLSSRASLRNSLRVPWHLIEGFTKLQMLHVNISVQEFDPVPLLAFPSTLQSIYLRGEDTDLSSLQSDTVDTLDISTYTFSKTMRTNSVTLPNWPNLNYVSLPACKLAMDWSRGQMRNLSTIYMTSFGDNIDWDYFTHFCCNLALHPEAIPQLTTLSLAQSPEWDILFILLERYNFRTAADNKMLKSLTLGDTPPDLRKPLQMLCGGKFTDRPPNIELSWIGNVDIIFDESLPGCLECHKLLLFCKYTTAPNRHLAWGLSSSSSSSSSSLDLPVDILGERSDSPLGISRMFGDIPKIEDLYIPTYPDNPQDVLLQWEQRENAWQSLQDFGRLRSCQKAGRSQVHISDSYYAKF